MIDKDFPLPPDPELDLSNPNDVFKTERKSSVTDYISNLENKASLKYCISESSFPRRSSLTSPNDKQYDSNPYNRHYSVEPSSESLFSNKFSFNNQNEQKLNSLRKTVALSNLNNSTSLDIAEVATMNKMNLRDLDNIDTDQIPGYLKIPDNIPDWKKYQLERKNKDIINDYLKSKQLEENERKKYGDIPQWKKDLIIKKEKQLIEQNNPDDSDDKKFGNIPQWKRELLKKKIGSKE